MVIADPFGSWVQGAHEGQQDAIAMRNAQDETAQRNYNLQREATFDPQQYRLMHNAADTSDLELGANRDIYGARIPQRNALAGANRAELGNAATSASMGDVFPYIQHQIQQGGQFTPQGIQYGVTDYQGNPTHYQTPYDNIGAANRYHYALQQEYQEARIAEQARGHDLTMDRFLESKGMNPSNAAPAPTGGYLGIPAAKTTTPAIPTTTAAGTPQQGINLNDPYAFHRPPGQIQ